MIFHYSPKSTEPVIPDDPGFKMSNRFVVLHVELVHIVLDIVTDAETRWCAHACDQHLKLFNRNVSVPPEATCPCVKWCLYHENNKNHKDEEKVWQYLIPWKDWSVCVHVCVHVFDISLSTEYKEVMTENFHFTISPWHGAAMLQTNRWYWLTICKSEVKQSVLLVNVDWRKVSGR